MIKRQKRKIIILNTDRTVLLFTVIGSEYNHHKHPQVLVPMTSVCTAPTPLVTRAKCET